MCGLIGLFGKNNAPALTANLLQTLQHRGEEAAGIAFSDGKSVDCVSGLGHVNKALDKVSFDNLSKNFMTIGHTRYSVTGIKNPINIQPLLVKISRGSFAIAHNGNLINSHELKKKLEKKGAIFHTTMDTEIFTHLIAHSKEKNFKDAIIDAVKQVKGAYSLLILTKDNIFAVRDPNGFRPLCWGEIGKSKVIASESCALDLIGAKYRGQVHPGEILTINKNSTISVESFAKINLESKCIFEMIYFSRPDSLVFGKSVYQFRKSTGIILAKEAPVEADLVIPIPDSGIVSALGYSEESKIPIEFGLTRNHYVGRSFIQPTQNIRDNWVRLKLNPIKNIINKKRVVLIDDSIVRGTTTRKKIKAIRQSGAKEIHLRIASPPIKHGCFYGIDFPNEETLIANKKTNEEIRKFLEVDSIAYISLKGLLKANDFNKVCTACFSGKYPIGKPKAFNKNQLETC